MPKKRGSLARCSHLETLELSRQAHVCEQPGRVLVEVQERTGLAVEHPWLLLRQLRQQPKLRQQRPENSESLSAGMLHSDDHGLGRARRATTVPFLGRQ